MMYLLAYCKGSLKDIGLWKHPKIYMEFVLDEIKKTSSDEGFMQLEWLEQQADDESSA